MENAAAPQQAALAINRQHDDHRVRAREMIRPASLAMALPAAIGGKGWLAAARAEFVRAMPGRQRPGGREHAKILGQHEALHADAAQIHLRPVIGHGLLGVLFEGWQAQGEDREALLLIQPQKQRLQRWPAASASSRVKSAERSGAPCNSNASPVTSTKRAFGSVRQDETKVASILLLA